MSHAVTPGSDGATPLDGRRLQIVPVGDDTRLASATKAPDGSVRLVFNGGERAEAAAGASIDGITNINPNQSIQVGLHVVRYARASADGGGSVVIIGSRAPLASEAACKSGEILGKVPIAELLNRGWCRIEVSAPARRRVRTLTVLLTNAGSAEFQLAPPLAGKARLVEPKSSLRENIESIVWAVAIALAIRTFIIAPFKIPSGSMRPTLIEGDRILVSKFTYRFSQPKRSDIIVFRYPAEPKRPFIKRLAGLAGEQLEIRDGRVLINGQPVDSPPMRHIVYVNAEPYGQQGSPIRVPGDAYFVLGDNSGSSHDSRFWGYVPKKLLIGKAVCIFWPPQRIRILR